MRGWRLVVALPALWSAACYSGWDLQKSETLAENCEVMLKVVADGLNSNGASANLSDQMEALQFAQCWGFMDGLQRGATFVDTFHHRVTPIKNPAMWDGDWNFWPSCSIGGLSIAELASEYLVFLGKFPDYRYKDISISINAFLIHESGVASRSGRCITQSE